MDLAVSPLPLVGVWFVLDFVRHHTLSVTGEKKKIHREVVDTGFQSCKTEPEHNKISIVANI